jgi:hypothetical protein
MQAVLADETIDVGGAVEVARYVVRAKPAKPCSHQKLFKEASHRAKGVIPSEVCEVVKSCAVVRGQHHVPARFYDVSHLAFGHIW